ncbi:uncharacterized protein N7483_008464 [Penicillium malachiteum]|uniref:uncharacterized protein n=1 Tax=Penicillium malachiteum TaxID=1324776 RepID=UPI00254901C3|nr:uncharacterized protein N7483_008464 [Penicillium malachiteum]KAJ5720530.1 hypothetical protein N7483_008464 [Penicillium malachiteum]
MRVSLRLNYGLGARSSIYTFISQSINPPSTRCFSSTQINNNLSPFTRRLYKLPSAPSAPSSQHDNLPQFLSYASRISLPESSTVYIGTHYEYTVLQSLRRYALALHRIGGRDDAGIDLAGTWHLPEHVDSRALRVLVQCKAFKTKLGPNLVRELEGALRQAPVGWRTGQTVGVLVSPREATKGVRDALARSSFPLFWMMIERDGVLRQALWNSKAEEMGLGALGVEMRYAEVDGSTESSELKKKVELTWDGSDIPDMESVELRLEREEERWVKSWVKDLEVDKNVLLDTIERVFPGGCPETDPDGTVAEVHQLKVIEALKRV